MHVAVLITTCAYVRHVHTCLRAARSYSRVAATTPGALRRAGNTTLVGYRLLRTVH